MPPSRSIRYNIDISTNTSPPSSSRMDRAQIINFLREYRVLECSCCDSVFGFQHKATGTMYCVDGCHERRSPPQSPPMMHSPNPMRATVSPPAGLMNRSSSITMISKGLHGAAGGVPNGIVGYKQPPIMPIAARVQPTVEAVPPISAVTVVENSPVQEKVRAQEAVHMSVKAAEVSNVQQSIPPSQAKNVSVTEEVPVVPSQSKYFFSDGEVRVTPSQFKNVAVTKEVPVTASQTKDVSINGEGRVEPPQPRNVSVTTEEVPVAPCQPQPIKSNVHFATATAISKTNVIQGSEDVPDARIKEPKPAPPVAISVKPNANVGLSRASIPWPDYRNSESVEEIMIVFNSCQLYFIFGGFIVTDGGLFLQSCAPIVNASVNNVRERIVDFIRSGKCRPLAKPAVGALCLAPFEGEHYRAEVIAAEFSGKWRVFFIDYGNTEILNSVDLLILSDDLKKEPRSCTFGYWDQVLAEQKKPAELFKIWNIEVDFTLVTFLQKITDGQYIVQIGEAAKATFAVEKPASIPVPVQVKSSPKWGDCIFSQNLLTEPMVHITYTWDPITYHVMADDDEESVTKLQTLIEKYVIEAEPLTRSPCLGEIVAAPYGGVYYRGKVDKVEGDSCTCTFVDFGDRQVIKIRDIKPVNDAIMKYPIYGMVVRLAMVPTPPESFTVDVELEQFIYGPSYVLELTQNGEIKPADLPHFDARLWDLTREYQLNREIKAAIVAFQ